MLLRLIMASIFTLAIGAQESKNKINFEIHAVGFPKDFVFQVELKLKHKIIDTQKTAAKAAEAGGRYAITKDAYLLEQDSKETHRWEISFNENGKAKIEGSPQSDTYSFSKPVSELSNALALVSLDGKRTLLANGRAVGNAKPFGQGRPFKEGTTYVLLMYNQGGDSGQLSMMTYFLAKEELKDALEGKFPGTNQLPGGLPQPPLGR
ncbi:MAG: hypothetical protein FWG02_07290 [Holophagaceae bacterium]|nr:hypothetical protein [Holophagaceae bacterium]